MAIHTDKGSIEKNDPRRIRSKYAAKKALAAAQGLTEEADNQEVETTAEEIKQTLVPPWEMEVSGYWKKVNPLFVESIKKWMKQNNMAELPWLQEGDMESVVMTMYCRALPKEIDRLALLKEKNSKFEKVNALHLPSTGNAVEDIVIMLKKHFSEKVTIEQVTHLLESFSSKLGKSHKLHFEINEWAKCYNAGVMHYLLTNYITFATTGVFGDNEVVVTIINGIVESFYTTVFRLDENGNIESFVVLPEELKTLVFKTFEECFVEEFSPLMEEIKTLRNQEAQATEQQPEVQKENIVSQQATVQQHPAATNGAAEAAIAALITKIDTQNATFEARAASIDAQVKALEANLTDHVTKQTAVNADLLARVAVLEAKKPEVVHVSSGRKAESVFGETMDGVATMVGYGTLGALTGYAVAKGLGMLFNDTE
jgi:hypothetical protein